MKRVKRITQKLEVVFTGKNGLTTVNDLTPLCSAIRFKNGWKALPTRFTIGKDRYKVNIIRITGPEKPKGGERGLIAVLE